MFLGFACLGCRVITCCLVVSGYGLGCLSMVCFGLGSVFYCLRFVCLWCFVAISGFVGVALLR